MEGVFRLNELVAVRVKNMSPEAFLSFFRVLYDERRHHSTEDNKRAFHAVSKRFVLVRLPTSCLCCKQCNDSRGDRFLFEVAQTPRRLIRGTNLISVLQEQHLRAQQAAGRLREQMQRHPSRSTADAQGTPGDVILRIRDLLARGEERGPPSTIKGGGGTDGSGGSNDRVAKLRRDVDGLQMGEWIQDTRSDACDRAQTLAREAGEEVQRGTGSDAVTEIEGELDGFAKELDSLLLRIDDPGGENDEGVGVEGDDDDDDDDEVDFVVRHQHSVSGEEAAPAADAYVGRPVLQ